MDDWRGEGEDFYFYLTGIRDNKPYKRLHRWVSLAAQEAYKFNIINVKLIGYRKYKIIMKKKIGQKI